MAALGINVSDRDFVTSFDSRTAHKNLRGQQKPGYVLDAKRIMDEAWDNHDELCEKYDKGLVTVEVLNFAASHAAACEARYFKLLNDWHLRSSTDDLFDAPIVAKNAAYRLENGK